MMVGGFSRIKRVMIRDFQSRGLLAWIGHAAFLACVCGAIGQSDSIVRIEPLGNTVALDLETPSEDTYILESQAQLMEGEEWAPLMQFRGNAAKPRNWIDPVCGDSQSKYFRLRRLLEEPRAEVSNFRLIGVDEVAYELYYHWPARAVVLLFVGRDVNAALEYQEDLAGLRSTYGDANLLTWVIAVSSVEERPTLAELTSGLSPLLPVLQDLSHAVTRTLGTGTTPEAVLIDTSDWSISYRGPVRVAIDVGEMSIEQTPLNDAVEEFFAGAKPSVSRLAALGEVSGVDVIQPSSYGDDIAPMLQQNCFPCHTPGNIAPWAMTDYGVVAEFAGLIKSAVLAGEMPPWHADPAYSAFSNSKSLTKEQVSMLVDWIDRGTPRGEGPDPLVDNPPPPTVDWPLGTPDGIVSIPLQSIPASGTVEYQYLFAQSPFAQDVWLSGVGVNPGDRSVVHHCLVFTGSVTELVALQGGLAGFFAGYVPGMEQKPFPEGTGKLLKKSDIIVFQMHYTVSGTATTDLTQLGLYVADAPPSRELVTSSAFDVDFVIPPNSQHVQVSATKRFDRAATLFEFSPHMHYRGSSAKYTLEYPNGSDEVILNVPAYFFDWQALYRLDEPISIPAGTVLRCEGEFDNSIQNRYNPDPSARVTFGEQSWEEMFIGYVNYADN